MCKLHRELIGASMEGLEYYIKDDLSRLMLLLHSGTCVDKEFVLNLERSIDLYSILAEPIYIKNCTFRILGSRILGRTYSCPVFNGSPKKQMLKPKNIYIEDCEFLWT